MPLACQGVGQRTATQTRRPDLPCLRSADARAKVPLRCGYLSGAFPCSGKGTELAAERIASDLPIKLPAGISIVPVDLTYERFDLQFQFLILRNFLPARYEKRGDVEMPEGAPGRLWCSPVCQRLAQFDGQSHSREFQQRVWLLPRFPLRE